MQIEKWQARRDSNPQHPVLETGALPVRATGLHACELDAITILIPYEEYAYGKNDNTC
jgi:hypothetical protein